MSKTPLTRKAKSVPTQANADPYALPLDRNVAIYYRQSTDQQVGNTSTALQREDLKGFLIKKGWQESQIILIDEDEGVSGTRSFEDRVGATRLYNLILGGSIGAVCVADIDRIARDKVVR